MIYGWTSRPQSYLGFALRHSLALAGGSGLDPLVALLPLASLEVMEHPGGLGGREQFIIMRQHLLGLDLNRLPLAHASHRN
jgi:hypothetical protein